MVAMVYFQKFLPIQCVSALRNLEKEANTFYDRANKSYKAALLTRSYVQHFFRPYIFSEVNHKRHFIKTPLINKGKEFIDLKVSLKMNRLFHLFLITLIIQERLSFAINITNL